MNFMKALFAVLFLLIAFSHQIWTTAQFAMPMSCSDEKESCVWYEEIVTAQSAPLFFIIPAALLLIALASSALRAPNNTINPVPVRIQPRQRSRVQRE